MAEQRRILLVNASDRGGGAERIAVLLRREYEALGADAALAVGFRRGDDPGVRALDHAAHAPSAWQRFWWQRHRALQPWFGRTRWARTMLRLTQTLAAPRGAWERSCGREDNDFPAARGLAQLRDPAPQIVHLHNLHGGYFDLRVLPGLSRAMPVVWTLHDAWALSGHCAHSLGCERWKTGCGACPDLSIYPAIRRDATARNWRQKRDIFRAAQLCVATPSRWLMQRVEQSQLGAAAAATRTIPNGVPLDTFKPGEKTAARRALGLPDDAEILLFAANGVRRNSFKDFAALDAAARMLATRRPGGKLALLALGEPDAGADRGAPLIRFVAPVGDPLRMALYYRAADVYLHAARADTFPNTILEALACGLPVVATAVGGIPEQIRCVESGVERPTGLLTPPADPAGLADAVERILRDKPLHARLSENAARDARERFDMRRCARAYLDWFDELLGSNERAGRRALPVVRANAAAPPVPAGSPINDR